MIGEVMDVLLVELALGDVLADAAVALESTGRVEHRLAADADPDLRAGFVQPAQLHVAELLVRLEDSHMLGPLIRGHVDVVLLPALLAYRREGLQVDPRGPGPAHGGEAELVVLFPIHVGRELGQAAEALLAFARHLLGPLALEELSDMRADDAHSLEKTL